VARVRVLISLPRGLVRESIQNVIAQEGDMKVVGVMGHPRELYPRKLPPAALQGHVRDLRAEVIRTRATAVLIEIYNSDSLLAHYGELLAEQPDLLIVAISAEGDRAYLCRRSMCIHRLAEVAKDSILAAIRTADTA
jgi:hypothetical protein